MAHIRYVCMSDLHLGADSSLLTSLRANEEPPDASPVMIELVACMRSLLADNDGVKPTLILLGDVLELALAEDEDAAMVFQRFAELVMPDGDELFDAIWYVPGNHDHHLWEGARETQYAEYVGRRDRSEPLEPPWHDTRMLVETDPHHVVSPLLTALLGRARAREAEKLDVVTVYPSLALRRGDRCIVFHHGHFIESPYYLLTTVDRYLFPEAPPPDSVGKLEADNFAWIDFLWSSLGRCGQVGKSVQYVFNAAQDAAGRKELVARLARGLAGTGLGGSWWDRLRRGVREWMLRWLIGGVAGLVGVMGMRAYYGGTTAEKAHDDGLATYVDVFVREQVTRECKDTAPNELTFVFGHTHSPYERSDLPITAFPKPVHVLNTGGWVHEGAERQELIGASLVLVDEELTPVSVRLYNEVDLSDWSVRAKEAPGSAEPSAFLRRVERLLENDPEQWRRLVCAVDDGLTAQCKRYKDV